MNELFDHIDQIIANYKESLTNTKSDVKMILGTLSDTLKKGVRNGSLSTKEQIDQVFLYCLDEEMKKN